MLHNLVVVGAGKMASDVVKVLSSSGLKRIHVFESEESSFSSLKGICRKVNATYHPKSDKSVLKSLLISTQKKTLVVSANNTYIFSSTDLSNPNVEVVNFHGAVISKYRGHGSVLASWVLFNMDAFHGATWHKVTPEIDKGEIICASTFSVEPTDTAITLMSKSLTVGVRLFEEHLPSFLSPSKSLNADAGNDFNATLLTRRDLPNQCMFSEGFCFHKASAFFRALDTRPLNYLPSAKINIGNRVKRVEDYEIASKGIHRCLGVNCPGLKSFPCEVSGRVALTYGSGQIQLLLSSN